jgi:tRNA-2-methylthio-N6-dimethylallyladenosine synthase
MVDDVADEVKARRVNEVLALSKIQAEEINRRFVGATHNILLEGESKKSPDEWQGRTDGNKMVIVPKGDFIAGSYLDVRITRSSAATLFGEAA